MYEDDLINKYQPFIKYLIKNGYVHIKDINYITYQKDSIDIKININEILIKDKKDNRRYFFNNETSNSFLINFLKFMNYNYKNFAV